MILGIDIGTSALKLMLLPVAGQATPALEREPLALAVPAADRAELDPEAVYAALRRALGRWQATRPGDLARVRAVGLSTIFPALVTMRADGSANGPALLYCDRRAARQAEDFADRVGPERLTARLGNQFAPGTSTLPGILWLRECEPARYRETCVFGELSTYLLRQLTGETVVDTSHTSLSGMVRSGQEERWDEALLELAGLTPAHLPRILAPTGVAGVITPAAAAATGIPAGTPVVAGGGDAPLAALGAGIGESGRLFASAGSTDCLMLSAARPSGDPVFCNVRGALPDQWLAIGTMSSAGAAVKWFAEAVLGGTVAELARLAATAAPGAGGACFVPYLQGERTPWWDPAARGAFTGLALTTGRAELCRAILEGVACGWRQIVDLLETRLGQHSPDLLAVGGGSTCTLHNRIKATLLQRPLRVLRNPETTSLGAALCAGLGAGLYPDLAAAATALAPCHQADIVDPVPAWKTALEDLYERYRKHYPALKPLSPRAPT